MLKSKACSLAFFFLATGAAALAQANPAVPAGLWQTIITSEVEGMPFLPPPETYTECVIPGDRLPGVALQEHDCEVTEQNVSGNRVDWRVQCVHEGMTTSGAGRLHYQGDSYQGEMTVEMSGGVVGEMKLKQTLNGQHLGECS
jgi:hypothetical protein